MSRSERFSRRHGLVPKHEGPLLYDEVLKRIRVAYLGLLEDDFKISPSSMRDVVCKELRKEPNPGNWSEYPNIWGEVQSLVYDCEWYEFFDIVEAFAEKARSSGGKPGYEKLVNQLFEEEGIGWVLSEGYLKMRGEEPLEKVLEGAFAELKASDFEVATQELSEAWGDLSRRPEPDLSGAVHHAMAALEAVAKEWGDTKDSLGDIIKKQPEMFSPPLNEAVAKLWGFASNNARHGSESRKLELDEAFLVVGTCATLVTYLARKKSESH